MGKTVEQVEETIKKARKILNKAEKGRKASFSTERKLKNNGYVETLFESKYDVEDYVVEVQEALKVLRYGK